jgi:hypothetical protein
MEVAIFFFLRDEFLRLCHLPIDTITSVDTTMMTILTNFSYLKSPVFVRASVGIHNFNRSYQSVCNAD